MINIYTLSRDDMLASNCYFVTTGSEAIVIDPSVSYDSFIEHYPELQNYKIRYLLITHSHADHFIEINSYLKDALEVVISVPDADGLSDSRLNLSSILGEAYTSYCGEFIALSDGDTIKLGDVNIKVIYTPGHTIGSACFMIEDKLFTGDTLFSHGGYGRFDFPGGNPVSLRESLKRLTSLDGDYTVYPGHGESEPLSESKKYFNFL